MRHIVAKKIVKSLTQQQLFYENFVLSSEVRIKEKEKNCSAVCNLSKEALNVIEEN